ncbi:MAG: hypothetical protein V5A37_00640 [Halobacteriales archaeon]
MVVEEIPEMINLFLDVALRDPLSFVLVATAGVLIGFSVLFVGYLALQGVGAWLSGPPGQGPPQQAR